MANKVKYNLKNVHWAPKTGEGYGTVSAWPGAVSLTLDPQGEDYTFYADGVAYFEYHTNNGYEGSLETALIPEAFRTGILGEFLETGTSLLWEVDDVQAVHFALGFQIDGDDKENLYWFYNCTASRPSVGSSTKEESIEVQTENLTFTCKPDPDISVNGKHPVRVKTADASTETYVTWFNEVKEPDAI